MLKPEDILRYMQLWSVLCLQECFGQGCQRLKLDDCGVTSYTDNYRYCLHTKSHKLWCMCCCWETEI